MFLVVNQVIRGAEPPCRSAAVQQLRRRHWDGAQGCKFCDNQESVDHLLFQFPIAIATWWWVRDSLGWLRSPSSISSYRDMLFNSGRGDKNMLWWIIAAVGWSLWKTRNDLVFSNIVIKSPKQVAHKALGFLKQSSMLAKKDEAQKEA
jgi:hypothetical protein